MNLFSSEDIQNSIKFDLPDAEITYFPTFFSSEKAAFYFNRLMKETEWQQDNIKLFGKVYPQPRLTALYADNLTSYTYSGITMFPKPNTSTLLDIKQKVEEKLQLRFTSALLNLYRSGSDSNGWHSDDEKELGQNPIIASLSLGAQRVFQLKHKKDKKLRKNIKLEHGSLLVMKGATQHFWQHQIPKSKKITQERINLTFRIIN